MSVDHRRQNRRDWLTIISWWAFAAWLLAIPFTVLGWYSTPVNGLDFNLALCPPETVARMMRWELAIAVVLVVGPIPAACVALTARRVYLATVFFAVALLAVLPATVIARHALALPSAAVPGEFEPGRC